MTTLTLFRMGGSNWPPLLVIVADTAYMMSKDPDFLAKFRYNIYTFTCKISAQYMQIWKFGDRFTKASPKFQYQNRPESRFQKNGRFTITALKLTFFDIMSWNFAWVVVNIIPTTFFSQICIVMPLTWFEQGGSNWPPPIRTKQNSNPYEIELN